MSEGFLGVVNSILTGPEAMQLESGTMLGQATQYTVDARQNPTDSSVGHQRHPADLAFAAFEATGLVVACVAGGHILLATAGVAGFGLNAAQQYMTDSLGK